MEMPKLRKADYQKIRELLKIKEYNIASAEALFSFTFEDLTFDKLEEYLDLDLDNNDELFFYEKYFKDLIVKLNIDDYRNNPYAKRINGLTFKEGKFAFKELSFKPKHLIPFDDIKIDPSNYLERSSVGYFEEEYNYPALLENNTVWMSLDPDEINTMKPYIEKMHGDILIFGLGMGYFPYMSSFNKNVKSITIIEKDINIVNIFNKYISPKLDNPIPFKIINEDAFLYIKNHDMKKFDSSFMDIWHNAEDGLPLFIKFKQLLKEYQGDTYYWLHKSLLAMYRRCLLTIIEESMMGYTDKQYQKAKNEYDTIINDLYWKTKDLVIDSYEQLVQMLSDDNLEKLLSRSI